MSRQGSGGGTFASKGGCVERGWAESDASKVGQRAVLEQIGAEDAARPVAAV